MITGTSFRAKEVWRRRGRMNARMGYLGTCAIRQARLHAPAILSSGWQDSLGVSKDLPPMWTKKLNPPGHHTLLNTAMWLYRCIPPARSRPAKAERPWGRSSCVSGDYALGRSSHLCCTAPSLWKSLVKLWLTIQDCVIVVVDCWSPGWSRIALSNSIGAHAIRAIGLVFNALTSGRRTLEH